MGPILEKLSCEKKEIILMGNFSMNILNCNSDKEITDFVGAIYASSLYSTSNTPTRITAASKALIHIIFYNDLTKKSTAGKITTSISDHLTQFLIIRYQTANFDNNRRKEVPKKLKI